MKKIFLPTYKNPNFLTLSTYVIRTLEKMGFEVIFFNDRSYLIPGRIRERMGLLEKIDLKRINRNLIRLLESCKPDLFFAVGGVRELPGTLRRVKKMNIPSVLWTIDCPMADLIKKTASLYDYVFIGGSEAYAPLKEHGVKKIRFLPFACYPELHKARELSEEDRRLYGCDIAFVGSLHPGFYPFRIKVLEALTDFNLGIWGPGAYDIPDNSAIKTFIRGEQTSYEVWTKIYSASKIILGLHLRDINGNSLNRQASPRVYEVLSCGGFLMVDNQKDVLALFNDKKDLVVFNDINELRSLVGYYLKHEDERKSIAESGHLKVLSGHTYEQRMKEMLSIVTKGG